MKQRYYPRQVLFGCGLFKFVVGCVVFGSVLARNRSNGNLSESANGTVVGQLLWTAPPPERAAPDPAVPHDTRIFLSAVAPPFHGSTSLHGLLMSSPVVTTLCRAGHWQCEGHLIPGAGADPKNRVKPGATWKDRLRVWSEVWNLSKPVLLQKSPRSYPSVNDTYDELLRTELPKNMLDAGVRRVLLAFVMMWRPPCLGKLSRRWTKGYESHEIRILDTYVKTHQHLISRGAQVLLVNLADLMWRGDYSEQRIKDFLPCLGQVSTDFIPKLGVDVFKGNKWKVTGSLRSYGAKVPPAGCCKYNVDASTCMGANGGWSKQKEFKAGKRLLKYLKDHS